ncbi:MAG: hypothetical protein AAB308_17155 [Nitrospirota bacterium]
MTAGRSVTDVLEQLPAQPDLLVALYRLQNAKLEAVRRRSVSREDFGELSRAASFVRV